MSDYLKGAITRSVIEALLTICAARRRPPAPDDLRATAMPLIVDPKIPHLACYAGATLVTPNHHEAEVATHLPRAHRRRGASRRRAISGRARSATPC